MAINAPSFAESAAYRACRQLHGFIEKLLAPSSIVSGVRRRCVLREDDRFQTSASILWR